MKYFLSILILFLTTILFGQKYQFSNTGTLLQSSLTLDTVYTEKKAPTPGIYFNNLDSLKFDTLRIKNYISEKYKQLYQGSLSFFYIANFSNKRIAIKQRGNRIVSEQMAIDAKNIFRPVNFYLFQKCSSVLEDTNLALNPNQIAILKSISEHSNTSLRVKSFIKVMLNDGNLLTSSVFQTYIEPTDFYINSDFQKDFNYALLAHYIAFYK